jgi:uncharacterized protein YrrD
MDFDFGADVRRPDGEKLGELRHVVYDPDTTQIVYLVVEHSGFEGREVLVPIGAVEGADDDAVTLELSRQQFDSLRDFVTDRNVAPPPDAANITEDEITEPVNVPDVPPVGAATGVESIAFTPIVQEIRHIPGRDEVIDGNSVVWATDGEVGKVRVVEMNDQTERITGFVVEKGLIFHHDLFVPIDWVENIRPEVIVLNVDQARVKAGQQA